MPPASDGTRTLGCALERLVPDPEHLAKIRDAVERTHKATILVTELLNLHLRAALERGAAHDDLRCFFDSNWLMNAYHEVTAGTRATKVVAELRDTRTQHMPPFDPPERKGIVQCLVYAARGLVATAATNIWTHFRKRVHAHVRVHLALDDAAYAALTRDQRRGRKLELMQVAADLCRPPGEPPQAPAHRHEWIAAERARLHIDQAVGDWEGKPLLYHLKARPHRFLHTMLVMSTDRERAARRVRPLPSGAAACPSTRVHRRCCGSFSAGVGDAKSRKSSHEAQAP